MDTENFIREKNVMPYNYTISENHTNSKTDPSPVILHDAYTDEPVWRDGSDIVFYFENGIIIRPHTAPNDTDRFLRTDGAELRLRNVTKIAVRNGKSCPCVGEQFIVLHHKYRPDAGVFQMELINNLRHGELYYDFTCEAVEYSFSEFAGDSWIQQARDHRRENIQQFLRQGRGEAVHMLRRMDDEERREYLDMVMYAVTHDLRFDHQCNADRTQYIFDLLESFDGEDREKLNHAILYGCWQEAAETYGIFEFDQYRNVLKRFTDSGESAAEETIRQMYETLRTAYEKRTEIPEGFDVLGQKYADISRFIGKPLPDDDEDDHVPHPRPAEPLQTIDSIIDFTRNPEGKTVHPARFRQFFLKKAAPDDVRKLAEAAKKETDPEAKARLYSLFGETDYPDDPAELIDLAREYEPMLHSDYGQEYFTAFKLQRALSRLHHPAVRAYGFELLERAEEKEDCALYIRGFEHWTANYDESSDLDRFCNGLTHLPEWMDENVRHSIEYTIVDTMFHRRYDDPCTYGHLVWVYDHTYCSCCRRKAVEILASHGMLQKAIRKQCLFDCDPLTRQIAETAEEI